MYVFILNLSRVMAYLGGAMLSALVLLTFFSVTGRAINTLLHADYMQETLPGLAEWLLATGVGPINGDFELVEAGMAFAIFAFLPLCQLTGGHATVDVFTARLPPALNRGLQVVIDLVFAVVLAVIAMQLYAGTMSKYASGQTTFLLQFPLWWAYALSLDGACVAALVGGYIAVARIARMAFGARLLPEDPGADL